MALVGFTEPMERRSLGPDKVRYARRTQHLYSAMDSVNVCQFVFGPAWQLYGPQELRDMIAGVTGWQNLSIDELLEVGERRVNMLRAFNRPRRHRPGARQAAGKNVQKGLERRQKRRPKSRPG